MYMTIRSQMSSIMELMGTEPSELAEAQPGLLSGEGVGLKTWWL